MTVNQMDVLAGIMVEHCYSHIQDKSVGAWIEEYIKIRQEISKYLEDKANETVQEG